MSKSQVEKKSITNLEPKSSVKVGCIQMCSGVDVVKNLATAERLVAQAAELCAKLVVLPEYFPVMADNHQAKLACQEEMGSGPIQNWIFRIAKQYGVWVIAGSIPIQSSDTSRPVARCLVVDDFGELQGYYDKLHMFDVEVDDATKRYCESAGTMPGTAPAIINTPWGALGLAICYDVRFPELFAYYRQQEVSFITLPSAFTVPTGKAHWETLLKARALDSQSFIIASAQSGTHENGRETWGHSMIVDPWGTIVGELKRETGVLVESIEIAKVQQVRTNMPLSKQNVLEIDNR